MIALLDKSFKVIFDVMLEKSFRFFFLNCIDNFQIAESHMNIVNYTLLPLKIKSASSNPWVTLHELGVPIHEFWVQTYQLRVQIQELLVQIHELRVQIHKFRVQIHELQVQILELRVQIHETLNQWKLK